MTDPTEEKKKRLGSVASMFDKVIDEKTDTQKSPGNVIDGKKIRMATLSSVRPDPNQPRKNINSESPEIQELAESIKKHGFINFITVREDGHKEYVIVAGERRYTAATVIGLKNIPVMVIAEDKADQDYALLQLEENLRREDLSPFEEASAYQRFKSEFGLNQKEIAQKMGKDSTYISRMMQINDLAQKIREEIEKKEINISRRVLTHLSSVAQDIQLDVWKKIRSNPTIDSLSKVINAMEKKKKKERNKKQIEELPAPELIFEKFKEAYEKDHNIIYQFFTPKKIGRLLGDL